MTYQEARINEYYERFKDLLKSGTWVDQETLRTEYLDMLPFYSADTLRRGSLLYKEFINNGLIKDVNKEMDKNIESIIEADKENNIPPQTKSIKYDSVGMESSTKVIKLDNDKLNDKNELLKAHGYNPNDFDLISSKHSLWKSGKNNELFSSKITVKPKTPVENKNTIQEILDDLALNYEVPAVEIKKERSFYPFKSYIVSFNDLHWGRYISKDLNVLKHEHDKNAEINRIKEVARKCINKINTIKNIEEIVILLGSDFFNSDCYGKTTIYKNPQDNNMNFKDMFSSGLKLCVDLIDMFALYSSAQKVKVFVIPGNHGNNEDFALGKCLEAWYRNSYKSLGVEIFTSVKQRLYYQYYNNLVGFTHGDKEKKNLSNLMAIEEKEKWGKVSNHIWITGHIHNLKESIIEDNGATIFSCPSLALDDEYTNSHGYFSKKRLMGFVLDKDQGLLETNYFYPDN